MRAKTISVCVLYVELVVLLVALILYNSGMLGINQLEGRLETSKKRNNTDSGDSTVRWSQLVKEEKT